MTTTEIVLHEIVTASLRGRKYSGPVVKILRAGTEISAVRVQYAPKKSLWFAPSEITSRKVVA